SIRESVRSLNKKKFIKILFTLATIVIISLLPLLGHRLLIRFFNYFGSNIVQWILTFAWYTLFSMFIPVYMYTAFFDIEDIEREDLIKNNRYGEQEEL
ncbi:MAG: hypothetical protein K2I79_04320, partial [Clostridia bacterium]|nr:hypothetical protein [Clostridia bacterium]